MLESWPSSTLRLLVASSTRKGRWVRHHQTEDTLPKKNGLKNGVKNEPKNGISWKTASRALFREFSFFLSFLASFWLCFSGKNKMKNTTVNYPNDHWHQYPCQKIGPWKFDGNRFFVHSHATIKGKIKRGDIIWNLFFRMAVLQSTNSRLFECGFQGKIGQHVIYSQHIPYLQSSTP